MVNENISKVNSKTFCHVSKLINHNFRYVTNSFKDKTPYNENINLVFQNISYRSDGYYYSSKSSKKSLGKWYFNILSLIEPLSYIEQNDICHFEWLPDLFNIKYVESKISYFKSLSIETFEKFWCLIKDCYDRNLIPIKSDNFSNYELDKAKTYTFSIYKIQKCEYNKSYSYSDSSIDVSDKNTLDKLYPNGYTFDVDSYKILEDLQSKIRYYDSLIRCYSMLFSREISKILYKKYSKIDSIDKSTYIMQLQDNHGFEYLTNIVKINVNGNDYLINIICNRTSIIGYQINTKLKIENELI